MNQQQVTAHCLHRRVERPPESTELYGTAHTYSTVHMQSSHRAGVAAAAATNRYVLCTCCTCQCCPGGTAAQLLVMPQKAASNRGFCAIVTAAAKLAHLHRPSHALRFANISLQSPAQHIHVNHSTALSTKPPQTQAKSKQDNRQCWQCLVP